MNIAFLSSFSKIAGVWGCIALAPAIVFPETLWTVQRAIEHALKNNPALKQAQLTVEAAYLNEPLLVAETDPRFSARYSFLDDQSPRAAPAFEGTRTRAHRGEVRVSQKTLIGTDARLYASHERIRNDAPFRTLNPSVDSLVGVEVTQPLLRYFWGRPDISRRQRFRAEVEAAEGRFQQEKAETISHIAQLYGEIAYSESRLKIGDESIRDAEQLLKTYTDKKRYGLVEETDMAQARVALEMERNSRDIADSHRQALQARFVELIGAEAISPADQWALPSMEMELPTSLAEAFRSAAQRPDIRVAHATLRSAQWALRSEKLDSYPDLSLSAGLAYGGLGREAHQSWDDTNDFTHSIRSFGLRFEVPLGRKLEKLRQKSRGLDQEKARLDIARLEKKAAADIENAWNQWQLRKRQSAAQKKIVDLQRARWDAERREFDRGRSATDTVIRFRQDWRQSELNLVRAHMDEFLARVELARVTGRIE